jgi:ABC-type bacteriocin/lantibiotic exporter with double-glycine peptidase domain
LNYSVLQLGIQAFQLLSPKQRLYALKNIGCSFLQASTEVISLTAIIPLLYQLVNSQNNEQSSTLATHLAGLTASYAWQSILLIVILIFVAKNLIAFGLARYQSQFTHEISVSFSEKLYHRFFRQKWTTYLKDNTAEAIRKIKGTSSDFANYVLHGYLSLLTDISICILILGGLIWFDHRIVLIILAVSTPIILFYYLFRKKIISKINTSFRDLTPKATIILAQGVDSFAEAKVYHKELFFINQFMNIRRTTSQYLANLVTATIVPPRIFEVMGIVCVCGVIAYTKVNPLYHQSMIVLLGLLCLAMYRIIPSLNRILINISHIQAYSYSVTELMNSFSVESPPSTKEDKLSFNRKIQIKNFAFEYVHSQGTLLKDVNITINKGDFVVIAGPSGVGKTTLIHLLAGLIQEYEGQILIDDTLLSPSTIHAWQNMLGFVAQAPVVLQDSILKNITFGEEPTTINVTKSKTASELACLDEFIGTLPQGFNTQVGENGLTLSGGQRQRLILARALYRNPEVLLLDEVTNQLDDDNKNKVLNNLKILTRKGKTIIVASHDPVVTRFANRILHCKEANIHEVISVLNE